ncbi:Synaptojanin-2-binding protein, partial [Sciurus carolinensis]|nr:Synaptojanin-2-binding protein [Sciurus carolinensis]
IYIGCIKEKGAVALDGRLQEYNNVFSIKVEDLKDLLHQDTVDLFHNAGYAVSLQVQRRLQVQNGLIGLPGQGEPSGIPIAMVLLPGSALTTVTAWAFMRHRQHL